IHKKWWEKYYPLVVVLLGAIASWYYLFGGGPSHRWVEGMEDYISFIILLASLFIISGGIVIKVTRKATPTVNCILLLTGAVIANLFGTTGAAMLLIRPYLRMNRRHLRPYHVVFFIFIVANVGGCLTPIGDPPLFLGYLQGIPFWWVAEHCWPMWCAGLGMLLAMFYAVDYGNYLRAPKAVRSRLAEPHDVWRFEGLSNLFFLAVILVAVFIHRPLFLREFLMAGAAAGSYFTTRPSIHAA